MRLRTRPSTRTHHHKTLTVEAPKLFKSAAKHVIESETGKKFARKMKEKARELVPGITPAMMDLGQKIIHNLVNSTGETAKPEKMKMNGGIVNNTAVGTISETVYKSAPAEKKVPEYMRDAQRAEFVCKSGYSIASGENTQQAGDMTNGGSTYVYTSCTYGGTTQSGNQMALPVILGLFANTTQTSKVFYEKCRCVTTYSNTTNTPITITVYECILKHDIQSPTASLGTTGVKAVSPYQAWSIGLSETTSATTVPSSISSALVTPQSIDGKPFDSPLFNAYWKIAASYTVNLSVGGIHRHVSEYELGTTLAYPRVYNSTGLAGITRNLLTVIQGVTGKDTTNTTYVIAQAAVEINHVWTYRAFNIPYSQLISLDLTTQATGGTVTVPSTSTTPTNNDSLTS